MNNLFKNKSNLIKILNNNNIFVKDLKSNIFTQNNLYKYLQISAKFKTGRFRETSPYIPSKEKITINATQKEINKPNIKFDLKFDSIQYPLVITSPLLAGMGLMLFHSAFIGSNIPEIAKFIFKSTFLYGSIFTGISCGVKFELDEKVSAETFSILKKKFFLLCGIFGISQSLSAFALPLPIFIGLYGGLYKLFSDIMDDVHEEIADLVYKSKMIILVIALFNLLFISLNYSDFQNSLNDPQNFDKLVNSFLSSNDEKFEGELIENEKCIRAVDYRLFRINNTDI